MKNIELKKKDTFKDGVLVHLAGEGQDIFTDSDVIWSLYMVGDI